MKKFILSLFSVIHLSFAQENLGISPLPSATHQAVVSLKSNVEIDHEYIMLSDFFDGIPHEKDYQILKAPAFGKTVTLKHAWISKLAQNFHLTWYPSSQFEEITFTRKCIEISHDDIQKKLEEVISTQDLNLTEEYFVALDQKSLKYQLNPKNAHFELEDFKFDVQTSRFKAMLVTDLNGKPSKTFIHGKIHKMITLPVLKKNKGMNELISQDDIEWKKFPSTHMLQNVFDHEALLIGMVPSKQMITAGEPIKKSDITKPIVIKKGNIVTLQVKIGTLWIATKAIASENASTNEYIKVTNIDTKKTIMGKVIDENTVQVEPTLHQASL